MALVQITPPAGIVKNGTDYSNKGRWVDGDLVRFENGYLKPIGGWDKLRDVPLTGTPIGMYAYKDNSGDQVLAIGTRQRVYVLYQDALYDVTPLRTTNTGLSNVFAASNGSSTITVTNTGHGAAVDDFVTISGASSLGGNITATVLNQVHKIVSVPDANTFTFTAKDTTQATVTANSSDTGQGGTGISLAYSGFSTDEAADVLGWGAGNYGREAYGVARSGIGDGESTLSFDTKSFSFANWGEDLLFSSASDGKIYRWQPSSPTTVATVLSNAPVNNEAVIVTNERHVFAIGSGGDPRKVAWSDREDNNTWAASATNSAGDLQVVTGGNAFYAVKWQTDVVVFTDIGIDRIYYSGSPFIYGIQSAGVNCQAISARTIVGVGNFLTWFGENSFFVFDGSVKEIKSDVHDYIYDNLNYTYRKASCGGHNSKFNEVWWFFPSGTSQTPNKYVIWNYKDNVWSVGSLDRSCWIDQGVFDFPIAGDSTGNIFEQDKGFLDGSQDLGTTKPFCQTGPLEIGNGDKVAQINQIIPDEETSTLPGTTLSFKGRFTPLGSETDFGSFTFENDGYVDARFSARQVQMKVEGSTTQDFQVGDIRVETKSRGKR